ncbi:MAG: hypothetical protein ACOCXM_11520 [Myxococcota bacterium]
MEPKGASKLRDVLDGGEVREVLEDTFYRAEPAPRPKRSRNGARKAKPDHYEVICISLYNEDLERLDTMVAELKRKGHRKMSRSALIRFALDHAPLEKLPKAY